MHMTADIIGLISTSCELLALGEPTHQEPAFGRVRNEILTGLSERGFRSIALETDRVAALAVNDFVHGGGGTLDDVLASGFSHGFGELAANRELVAWMREHNLTRPASERVAFHGFDAAMENFSAPSPRGYLAYAAGYLGFESDLAALVGDDQRWSRNEAVLEPAASPGATTEAERLRVIADELLTTLYARAPERIAATSREAWLAAKTHLTAGRDLLRYHRECARVLEPDARMSALLASRDSLMAQNLLEIRELEARRGPTMVCAHNLHLQRNVSGWETAATGAGTDVAWYGAGAIVAALMGASYRVIAGSLGRSDHLGLGNPAPGTYEAQLQQATTRWSLTPAYEIPEAFRTRDDMTPRMGYFPLTAETIAGVDGVLHVTG